MYDAIIIGAGPAGCAAAYDLATAKKAVLLLDKRRFPRVKPCAGALTIKAIRALRYSIAPVVRHVACNMAVSKRLEQPVLLKSGYPLCAMTVRSELDHFCLKKTIEAGAEFGTIKDIHGFVERDGHVSVQTNDGELKSKFLIGADGANSRVRQLCGEATWFRRGLAIEATVPRPDAHCEMEFDFGVVESGYGWVFPKGDHLNVGIYTSSDRTRLNRGVLLEYTRRKLGAAQPEEIVGHYVGFGGGNYSSRHNRIFLVGDAAGLVDPYLGEGIYNAILSGQAVAEAVNSELTEDTPAREKFIRAIGEVQADVAACDRLAARFYGNLDDWYGKLTSRLGAYLSLRGTALGFTYSRTKKQFFLLPFLPTPLVPGLEPRVAPQLQG
jgi:geranylgeranyl reductase family protein